MKEKTRKLIVKVLALAMAGFMCIGTLYYVLAFFFAA